MHEPAQWNDDSKCGHLVAHEFQTHYCTYIRATRLLSLQRTQTEHPDEVIAILALQAIELWLRVVRNDLEAARTEIEAHRQGTFELPKLLNRASTLIRLLDRHTDLAESILLDDLGLELPLSGPLDDLRSTQLRDLEEQTQGLSTALAAAGSSTAPYAQAGRDFIGRSNRWSDRYQRLLADLFERDRPAAPELEEYLAIQELLSLDQGVKGEWAPKNAPPPRSRPTRAPSPDELMFIVAHQVFELWFRALIHELKAIQHELGKVPPEVELASRRLRRVVRIQKMLVNMIHIPATMLPMDFLRFRSRTKQIDGVTHYRGLEPASGTESFQFREIEIMAGLRDSVGYREFLEGNQDMHIRFITPAQEKLLEQPSMAEIFDNLVRTRKISDLTEIFSPSDVENPNADLAELADLLLEFDQFFQLWRVNHLTMVQSMIGRKSGTGYLGPEYLRETVGMGMQRDDDRLLQTPQMRPRFFEDLWEVRTRMQVEEPQ